MTPDAGWIALAVPVVGFALLLLVPAWVMEELLPWLRGGR